MQKFKLIRNPYGKMIGGGETTEESYETQVQILDPLDPLGEERIGFLEITMNHGQHSTFEIRCTEGWLEIEPNNNNSITVRIVHPQDQARRTVKWKEDEKVRDGWAKARGLAIALCAALAAFSLSGYSRAAEGQEGAQAAAAEPRACRLTREAAEDSIRRWESLPRTADGAIHITGEERAADIAAVPPEIVAAKLALFEEAWGCVFLPVVGK